MVNHTCGPFVMILTLAVVLVESYVLSEQTKKKLSDSLMLPCLVTLFTSFLVLLEGLSGLNVTNLPIIHQINQQGVGGELLVQFIFFSLVNVGIALLVRDQLKMKLSLEKAAKVFAAGSATWVLLGYFVQHGGWCTF